MCVTNTEGYVTFSSKGLTRFSPKCSFWYIKNHFLSNTLSTQTITQIITKSMWMMQNWYDI